MRLSGNVSHGMNMKKLINGTRVIVHSFGDGEVCGGTIKGLISEHITRLYIVELDSPNPWSHDYDCISVPEGCLKLSHATYSEISS